MTPQEPTPQAADDVATLAAEVGRLQQKCDAMEDRYEAEIERWVNRQRSAATELATVKAENERLLHDNAKMTIRLGGADRLADVAASLVTMRQLDSRSMLADALLDYRNPPRTQKSDQLAAILPAFKKMRQALGAASIFIKTGVEFGYIRLPSSYPSEYRDPALDTLPLITEALQAAQAVIPKETP